MIASECEGAYCHSLLDVIFSRRQEWWNSNNILPLTSLRASNLQEYKTQSKYVIFEGTSFTKWAWKFPHKLIPEIISVRSLVGRKIITIDTPLNSSGKK